MAKKALISPQQLFQKKPVCINSVDELQDFAGAQSRYLFPNRKSKIILNFNWLPDVEKKVLERRLEKYIYACGCGHGAVFLIVGLLALIPYAMLFGLYPFGLWSLVLYPALLLLFTCIGKSIGIIFSRSKLKRMMSELRTIESDLRVAQ